MKERLFLLRKRDPFWETNQFNERNYITNSVEVVGEIDLSSAVQIEHFWNDGYGDRKGRGYVFPHGFRVLRYQEHVSYTGGHWWRTDNPQWKGFLIMDLDSHRHTGIRIYGPDDRPVFLTTKIPPFPS